MVSARCNEHFYRPFNAHFLQKGVLTDANQEQLSQARLCNACHWQDIKVNGAAEASSDAALEKILAKNTDVANSSAKQLANSIVQYAKAKITAYIAAKFRNNQAALLAEVFKHFNDILGNYVIHLSLVLTHFVTGAW